MTGILTLLNTLLPQMLVLYKNARAESQRLNEQIPTYSDADLIRLFLAESEETQAQAQAILDRLQQT